ncbi:MAG: DNA alkylation repair protein [Bacteroidaceae bacterium]|nr:DNA alkylation repair protein [Bacteroidaceae bacterium]
MITHILHPLVCERFKADERYREGHLRVVNALPGRRVLGLHSPEIKQVAKLLSREGGEVALPGGTLRFCANGADVVSAFEAVPSEGLCYEETVIWGYLINLEKCSLGERLAMLGRYVPVMDNWAVCDSYCAHAKWMAHADKAALWAFLDSWLDSGHEFEVRFAVVAAMCYFLNEEWLDKVFERIDRLDFGSIKSAYVTVKGKPKVAQQGSVQGAEPYYVRMGVAWLLATALAKFPERTRDFVRSSHLPADVVRLYVRKARESFRTRTVEAL